MAAQLVKLKPQLAGLAQVKTSVQQLKEDAEKAAATNADKAKAKATAQAALLKPAPQSVTEIGPKAEAVIKKRMKAAAAKYAPGLKIGD